MRLAPGARHETPDEKGRPEAMTSTTTDEIGMQRLDDEDDVAVPVTEFRALPPGTYPVEFLNFERMQTQFGEALKLIYRITEGPEADATVDEVASLKGGRGSKLKSRLGALRGAPYKPGEVLRPRELFGRTAQAYVTVVKIKDDDGTEFEVNRIGDLTPLPSRPTPRPAPNGTPGAARRPAPPPPPAGRFRVAPGLESQPPGDDPGWDAMQPPPAEHEDAG